MHACMHALAGRACLPWTASTKQRKAASVLPSSTETANSWRQVVGIRPMPLHVPACARHRQFGMRLKVCMCTKAFMDHQSSSCRLEGQSNAMQARASCIGTYPTKLCAIHCIYALLLLQQQQQPMQAACWVLACCVHPLHTAACCAQLGTCRHQQHSTALAASHFQHTQLYACHLPLHAGHVLRLRIPLGRGAHVHQQNGGGDDSPRRFPDGEQQQALRCLPQPHAANAPPHSLPLRLIWCRQAAMPWAAARVGGVWLPACLWEPHCRHHTVNQGRSGRTLPGLS